MLNIPQDLHDYLDQPENRQMTLLDGEVRQLTFFAPSELTLGKFDVDSFELYENGLLPSDPEERKEYEGYSLIKECDAYEPDGIFIWFPQFNAYGSWDCDHRHIIIYPDVSWTEILREPTWYINGQWYPERVAHVEVNPWL